MDNDVLGTSPERQLRLAQCLLRDSTKTGAGLAIGLAIGELTASADACRRAGHGIEIVSCGGTGTFPTCVRQPGITEVQVGGGIFSDQHYRNDYHVDLPCALSLLATVTSRPTRSRRWPVAA
jgi:D-serine deaminase-like pyridoxal phosphate-dependent protein